MPCKETWSDVTTGSEVWATVAEGAEPWVSNATDNETWYDEFLVTEGCDYITTEDGKRIYIDG